MEKINSSKESYYKETLTGKIALKFKEIISKKWENILLKKESTTGNYLNKFEYNGRDFSSRTVYPNSEVWDYELWEWIDCVNLWDVAVFPEFLQAVQEIEREEWIKFHITESIWISDCLLIAWKEWINFKDMANNVWLKDPNWINKILLKIKKDLSAFFEPEYKVWLNHLGYNLYIRAFWENKQAIIEKSPLFMKKLELIADYFDKNMEKIKQEMKNLAKEDEEKKKKITTDQKEKMKNLKDSL